MKVLTVALPQIELVHPSYSADQPDLQTLLSVLYEPLLRWRKGRLSSAAISHWSTPDGGYTWELRLREGIVFADGTPCDAEAVLQCIMALKDADGPFGMGGVYAHYLSEIEVSVTARDRLTLRSRRATADYLDLLAAFYVYRPGSDGGAPLGTTGYRLVEHEAGNYAVVDAVGPLGDRDHSTVRYVAVPSSSDRVEMIDAGGCDVCVGVEGLPNSTLDESAATYHGVPNTLSVTMFLNGFEGPFADVRARQAINHAIDIQEVIDEVWHGHATPASTVVSPFHYGFPANQERLPFDPARALELFEQCAMPARLKLRAPLVTPDRSPAIGQQIVEQLGRLGLAVDLELEPDRPKYAKDVSEKKIAHGAIFDSSPLSTFRILQEKVRSYDPGLWWQGVHDPEINDLIEVARGTHEEPGRWQNYESILRTLAARPAWLYLFHPVRFIGLRDESLRLTLKHSGVIAFDS